jgi:hypothetical protein
MDESLGGPEDEIRVGENGLLLSNKIEQWELIPEVPLLLVEEVYSIWESNNYIIIIIT